ncbi:hypothetical protein B0J14DRAFT_274594 [Halenospora varia]|nr:hypothetical protein B0J14DRAFT_274594 [Halenospora varia]
MRQLKDITEHQCYNEFVDLFIEAFEDMDTQWLEIREARKDLFKLDILNQPECSIDLGLWRCDERVNWCVNEPDMSPLSKQEMESQQWLKRPEFLDFVASEPNEW